MLHGAARPLWAEGGVSAAEVQVQKAEEGNSTAIQTDTGPGG